MDEYDEEAYWSRTNCVTSSKVLVVFSEITCDPMATLMCKFGYILVPQSVPKKVTNTHFFGSTLAQV